MSKDVLRIQKKRNLIREYAHRLQYSLIYQQYGPVATAATPSATSPSTTSTKTQVNVVSIKYINVIQQLDAYDIAMQKIFAIHTGYPNPNH